MVFEPLQKELSMPGTGLGVRRVRERCQGRKRRRAYSAVLIASQRNREFSNSLDPAADDRVGDGAPVAPIRSALPVARVGIIDDLGDDAGRHRGRDEATPEHEPGVDVPEVHPVTPPIAEDRAKALGGGDANVPVAIPDRDEEWDPSPRSVAAQRRSGTDADVRR
jgi:hypothetical protein